MRNGIGKTLRVVIVAAIALVALCTGGLMASAEATPPALTATPVEAALTGNAAGAFAAYTVNYPGDSADVRIQVTFAAHDAEISKGIGLNVYGPNGFSAQGTEQSDGYLEVSFCQEDAATLYVQVYNYWDGMTMPFSIVAEGLPGAATATASEAAATATPVASTTSAPANPSGAIVGNTAGSFGKHVFNYAADDDDVTITMTFSPADPTFNTAFGFDIYSPSGALVAQGTGNGTNGEMQATFSATEAGGYLVQVYNYSDGVMLNYTLAASR